MRPRRRTLLVPRKRFALAGHNLDPGIGTTPLQPQEPTTTVAMLAAARDVEVVVTALLRAVDGRLPAEAASAGKSQRWRVAETSVTEGHGCWLLVARYEYLGEGHGCWLLVARYEGMERTQHILCQASKSVKTNDPGCRSLKTDRRNKSLCLID